MTHRNSETGLPEFDLAVIGGGRGGTCAAIAASRPGAKTLLVERFGCFGVPWTSGILIADAAPATSACAFPSHGSISAL